MAVAFSIMDLDSTGFIERDEVARCLAAVLKEDPRVTMDETTLQEIIDKAGPACWSFLCSILRLHALSKATSF